MVVNAGLGSAFCALPILIMEHVDHSQTAAVNALNALARVIGSVLSSAIVTAVMASGAVLVAGQGAARGVDVPRCVRDRRDPGRSGGSARLASRACGCPFPCL